VRQTGSYNNATDNFKAEKSARKSAQNLRRRIHENDVHNLQVTCAEFSWFFWRRILTNLVFTNQTLFVSKPTAADTAHYIQATTTNTIHRY